MLAGDAKESEISRLQNLRVFDAPVGNYLILLTLD
jgi:hypothetical protein